VSNEPQKLLDAFARGDRRAVAGMVRYRLVVDAGGLMIPVVDRATLLQMWDVVFPPEVRCLIEESGFQRPGQPKPKYAITADAGGAWYGDRRVRVDRGPDGLKISRMTFRLVSAPAPPASRVRCCSGGEKGGRHIVAA